MRTVLLACLAAILSAAQAQAPTGPAALVPPYVVPKPPPVAIEKADWTIKLKDGQPDVARLREAFSSGGSIIFDTGGQPVVLKLDAELMMAQSAKPIILDGMGLVTIDGQEKTRAIAKEWKTEITVQRLRFINCRTPKTGAAIANTNFDGRTTVIDCQFENCKTTNKGPDDGGGAIGVRGQRPLMVSNCSFKDCDASNGGAINTIQCDVRLIDCSFEGCDAVGTGGGAERGGQGGIGGAVYCDSVVKAQDGWEFYVAGCLFRNNSANDHAGGMFAYNEDKLGGHVFWNCHFENNTVGKDGSVKHAGAIYTQYSRHLWVGNCSFWDNSCPGMSGTVFTAMNLKEEFIGCQFAGNSPEFSGTGVGLQYKKTTPPPCVVALGNRIPGPIGPGVATVEAKKAAKPKAEAKPPPAPVQPKAKATPEARKAFTTKLQARAIAVTATGKGPVFLLSSMKAQATIESADERDMQLQVGGTGLTLAWTTLADADRAEIALYLVRSDTAEDHALAAFWLKAAGRDADAATHLIKAGAGAAEVEGGFK